MRFIGREDNTIDIDYTCEMIDRYLAAGGNYFDTSWVYPNSEATLKKALVDRHPRESFFIATKCIAWAHCNGPEDLRKQLKESLDTLGVDYIDVYLMHNLGGNRTAAFDKYEAWEFMKEVKRLGHVRYIGFSAHCTPEELEQFIRAYPEADLVQLQINYLDWENPSFRERECVEIAVKHGLPIVAMEPVKGGLLANPSQAAKEVIDRYFPNDSYSTAALRFTASVPGVKVTLSGMNSIEQVEDNSAAFESFKALDENEMEGIDAARDILTKAGTIPCTGCEYCAKVCPNNIGISRAITALNYYIAFGDPYAANYQLGFVVRFNGGKALPSECMRCGACGEVCPQGIDILDCFDRIEREIVPFSRKIVIMKS